MVLLSSAGSPPPSPTHPNAEPNRQDLKPPLRRVSRPKNLEARSSILYLFNSILAKYCQNAAAAAKCCALKMQQKKKEKKSTWPEQKKKTVGCVRSCVELEADENAGLPCSEA